MGDKPSVEAKNFQSDFDDHRLFQYVPVVPQDVQAAADTADGTSPSDRVLNRFGDSGRAVPTTEPTVFNNGARHTGSSHVSPTLSDRLNMSSPKRKMKQSKSANQGMNGNTTAALCRDDKRSLSMEASVMTANCPADNSSAVDNCVESCHNEAAAAANSAPVEPSSPSTSSTVTVVSVVHANSEGRHQKSGMCGSDIDCICTLDTSVMLIQFT